MYAFTVFERFLRTSAYLQRFAPTTDPLRQRQLSLWPHASVVWWLRLGIDLERIKPGHRSRMAAMSACI